MWVQRWRGLSRTSDQAKAYKVRSNTKSPFVRLLSGRTILLCRFFLQVSSAAGFLLPGCPCGDGSCRATSSAAGAKSGPVWREACVPEDAGAGAPLSPGCLVVCHGALGGIYGAAPLLVDAAHTICRVVSDQRVEQDNRRVAYLDGPAAPPILLSKVQLKTVASGLCYQCKPPCSTQQRCQAPLAGYSHPRRVFSVSPRISRTSWVIDLSADRGCANRERGGEAERRRAAGPGAGNGVGPQAETDYAR